MNVSGIGKRTPALEQDLEVARKYRKVACSLDLDSNLAAGDKIILTGTIGDHGFSSAFGSARINLRQRNKIRCKTIKSDASTTVCRNRRGYFSKRPDSRRFSRCAQRVDGKIQSRHTNSRRKGADSRRCPGSMRYARLDPLEVGNEGKYIIGVVKEKAQEVLEFLKQTEEGKNAQIIGEATTQFKGVAMQT